MKKRILAMALACLMVLSVVSFVGCSNNDAAVEEQATKIADLESATAALKTAIDTNAADIDAAIADFNAAIEAVEGDVTAELDAVRKTATDALEAATKTGNTQEILETIATVQTLCAKLEADVTTLNDAVAAALETVIALEDWNAATDAILDAIEDLGEAYDKYDSIYYTAAEWAKIENALAFAEICLLRAPSVEAVEKALATFTETADAAKLIIEQIADKLDAIEAGELATLEVYYKGEAGKSLLDDDAVILLTTAQNKLDALYNEYMAEHTAGHLPDSEVTGQVGTDYTADVAALAKYVAREAALQTAKTEAVAINATVAELTETATAVTAGNQAALATLKTTIDTWVSTYFSGDFASEIAIKSTNYKMVDWTAYEALVDAYAALSYDFEAALKAFVDAYTAIGEVNLLSADKIEAAKRAYLFWIDNAEDASALDYVYDGKAAGTYYTEFVAKVTEYNALIVEASEAYLDVYVALTPSTVTIYDAATVAAMVKWYEDYAVVDGEAYVFGNGYPLKDGTSAFAVTEANYTALVAVKEACDALVAAKTAETKAVNDAIAALGTADMANPANNQISLNDKADIAAARAAYDAWVAGTNAPEGYTANQYKIDAAKTDYVANETALTDAETYVRELEALVTEIKNKIAALNETAPDATEVATINGMIDTFKTVNCGSDEGYITAEEYAKLEACEFVIAQNGAIDQIRAAFEALVAEVQADTTLTDVEKAEIIADLTTSFELTCEYVGQAETSEAVNKWVTVWADAQNDHIYDVDVTNP